MTVNVAYGNIKLCQCVTWDGLQESAPDGPLSVAEVTEKGDDHNTKDDRS